MTTIYKYVKYRNWVKKNLFLVNLCSIWKAVISEVWWYHLFLRIRIRYQREFFCIICTYELKKCRKLIKKLFILCVNLSKHKNILGPKEVVDYRFTQLLHFDIILQNHGTDYRWQSWTTWSYIPRTFDRWFCW